MYYTVLCIYYVFTMYLLCIYYVLCIMLPTLIVGAIPRTYTGECVCSSFSLFLSLSNLYKYRFIQ